ncbi:MAG TPA: hypothetical protein PLA88_00630 [Bacteroidales bacterium]|nr:hypothetical protein [Bacteroidales bacterium]
MKTIILLIAVLLVSPVYSQSNRGYFSGTHVKHRYEKEFNLSGFTGMFLEGPKNNIEKTMRECGLGDTYRDPETDLYFPHPNSTYHLIYDAEASYYFSGNSGVSLNYGLFDNVRVEGYDDIGSGNSISLRNKLSSISACYVFHTSDNINSIFVGPALLFHEITFLKSTSTLMKMGFFIGYTQRITRWDRFFIAVKVNYRWSPKTLIGPFIESNDGINGLPNAETFTSEFPQTKVNTGCFNLGIAVGVRI